LPLVDFAYQGFGDGLEADANGLRILAEGCGELLICSSFSKNFGLYNERVGALSVVAKSSAAAEAVLSHIKSAIRSNYSNPPSHGASIVSTILADAAMRKQWETELVDMCDRINGMRKLFVETLAAKGVKRDFGFIQKQKGMFSFSGLDKDQVQTLKDKHAIYIVGGGRINVAGMTTANMDRLCNAIAGVMR
ncbi:MAG: aminotransferase class I/II-fold pyridoxal phosphate-dependent enzyme, partial [Phycisphaeraceae bacterium]|nr:aminotransferase class I/II-fold pyridoxal phosphate-dependent enzyme [Phycisphaeraceae bacterium]